jgi:uncharacterized protein
VRVAQAPDVTGRAGEIRTRDPLNPIQVRYQAAFPPDRRDWLATPPCAVVAKYMAFIYTRPMDLVDQLRGCTGFEWDDGNSGKNWEKHRVSDGECEQVFFNQPLVALPDAEHSEREHRILVLGKTDSGRRLFVVCTPRRDLIRVISAREMTKREREAYLIHGG